MVPLDDYQGPELNALENELDQLNHVGEEVTISKLGEPVITKKANKKTNVPVITDGMVNAFKACKTDDQEPECVYWAKIGECEATSMRMLTQCCRSCKKRFTQDEKVLKKVLLRTPPFVLRHVYIVQTNTRTRAHTHIHTRTYCPGMCVPRFRAWLIPCFILVFCS